MHSFILIESGEQQLRPILPTRSHIKEGNGLPLGGTVMFVLNLVVLALLSASSGLSGKRKCVPLVLSEGWVGFFFFFFFESLWRISLKILSHASLLDLIPCVILLTSIFTGIPRYIHGQWVISEDNLPYEDANAPSLAEESVWPDSPSAAVDQMLVEDQNMLTTPEQYVLGEQGGL